MNDISATRLLGEHGPVNTSFQEQTVATPFNVVFALYPRITQLDFTGPYEVLTRLPGARCVLASVKGGDLEVDSVMRFSGLQRLDSIDDCVTPAGSRLLAQRLSAPLCDPAAINARLDAVASLGDATILATRLRTTLKSVPDLTRALTRLALGRGDLRHHAMPGEVTLHLHPGRGVRRRIHDEQDGAGRLLYEGQAFAQTAGRLAAAVPGDQHGLDRPLPVAARRHEQE